MLNPFAAIIRCEIPLVFAGRERIGMEQRAGGIGLRTEDRERKVGGIGSGSWNAEGGKIEGGKLRR